MLERDDLLIFLLNVSNVGGGAHSHQAIFFILAPRLYGESPGAHQVDSERRHLLPTQHAQHGQSGCSAVVADTAM